MVARCRVLTGVVAFLILPLLAFAAGQTEEKNYKAVEGLKNWNQTLDLGDRKPGQYNLLIRGKDEAGNISFSGPFNIMVDPDSDLPIPAINNPVAEMRVGGTLNIVGTCVDDDGVGKVELKIDDGEWVLAKGTEFWSYQLDGKTLPDGFHLLTVRATDIKGVQGREIHSSFNLDKFKPLNKIASHGQGVLVSGQLKLEGTIEDANNISRFFVSRDGGKSYLSQDFSFDQKTGLFGFRLEIDTRQLPDGPNVWWFKSIDKTRSIGYSAFLFFVDNTLPKIEIYKPSASASVQGRTHFVGRAQDALGIRKLSYTVNRTETEIPLTPGDPYFSVFADLPVTGNETELVFSATDTTGNVANFPFKFKVDAEADLPRVQMRYPLEGSIMKTHERSGAALSGFISDDDGPAALWYAIDGKEAVRVDAAHAFRIPLAGLPSGPHTLSCWGEDVLGAKGKPLVLKFTSADAPAVASLVQVTGPAGTAPFIPGAVVSKQAKTTIQGQIFALNPPKSARVLVGGVDKALPLSPLKTGGPGEYSVSFDLPAAIPYGVVSLEVQVEDAAGQSSGMKSFVYVTNNMVVNDEHGIVLADPRLDAGTPVSITPDSPLTAFLVGGEVAEASLEPPMALVGIEIDGPRMRLVPKAEGIAGPFKLKVLTRDKHRFETQALTLLTDSKAPVLEITSPGEGFVVKESLTVTGKASDGNKVATLEYSLDEGQSWTAASLQATGAFSVVVPFQGEDGTRTLMIRALDAAGNQTLHRVSGHKDSTPPLISIQYPLIDQPLKRFGIFAAAVEEAHGLASLDYSLDGSAWLPLDIRPDPAINLDFLQARDKKLAFRAVDRAGNQTVQAWGGTIDAAVLTLEKADLSYGPDRVHELGAPGPGLGVATPSGSALIGLTDKSPLGPATLKGPLVSIPESSVDAPQAGLLFPPENAVLKGRVSIGGYALGQKSQDPKAKAPSWEVQWRIDGGDWQSLAGTEFWSAVVDLSGLAEGTHKVSTRVIGQGGVESPVQERSFTVANRDNGIPASHGPLLVGAAKAGLTVEAEGVQGLVWTLGTDQKSARELKSGGPALDVAVPQGRSLLWLAGRDQKTGRLARAMAVPVHGVTAPKVDILAPSAGQSVNGIIMIRALVESAAPIKAIRAEGSAKETWTVAVNGAAGSVALPVDLSKSKDGSLSLVVEDSLGQKTTQALKLALAPKADEAVITMIGLANPAVLKPGDTLTGLARDDDGVVAVRYRFNGGESREVATADYFRIPLDLAPGKHVLSVQATDRNGLAGQMLTIPLVVSDGPPLIRMLKAADQVGEQDWVRGMSLGELKNSLSGTISTANGIAQAELSFSGGPAIPLLPKQTAKDSPLHSFSVQPPATLPFGRVDLEIRVKDSLGQTAVWRDFFWRVDRSFTGSVLDDNGVYLSDPRIQDDGRVFLRDTRPMIGFFRGRPIARVEFTPPASQVKAGFEGRIIRLAAVSQGISQPTRLKVVTVDGDEFLSPQTFVFHVDGKAPQADFVLPAVNQWLGATMKVHLALKEDQDIRRVEYYMDEEGEASALQVKSGVWVAPVVGAAPAPAQAKTNDASGTTGADPVGTTAAPVAPAPAAPKTTAPAAAPKATTPAAAPKATTPKTTAPATTPKATTPTTPKKGNGQSPEVGSGSGAQEAAASTFDLPPAVLKDWHVYEDLDLSTISEGAHLLTVRILDSSDNETLVYLPFQKDVTPPEVEFVSPRPDDKVNGLFTLTATTNDEGVLAGLTWSTDGKTFLDLESRRDVVHGIDLSSFKTVPEAFTYRVVDKAGNSKDFNAPIAFDPEADKPVVQIQLPLEMQVIERDGVMRQDFSISGMAFDDDRVEKIFWRIDPKNTQDPKLPQDPWNELPGGNNFAIPVSLATVGDNAHLVEMKAVDMYGVEGNVVSRTFYVSTEEPVATLVSPDIALTNRGIITLKGTASDANGIKEVWVSMDNGNSFSRANGTETWDYTVDTRIYQDGTYSVQVKVIDKYETEGLFASLLSLDNTAPRVSLDRPASGEGLFGSMNLDGRVGDNKLLAGAEYVIYRLDAARKPVEEIMRKPLKTSGAFLEEVSLAGFDPGWYSVRIDARDKADNHGYADSHFMVLAEAAADRIEVLYPLPGESLSGFFHVEGRVVSKAKVEKVQILAGNEVLDEVPVNQRGYFRTSEALGPGKLKTGAHLLKIRTVGLGTQALASEDRAITYAEEGPWVFISDRTSGDYLRNRPFVAGKVGWNAWPLDEEQKQALAKDELARREHEAVLEGRRLTKVEISFDNGKTFAPAQLDNSNWKYRIESLEMPDGPLYMVVRASFQNNASSVARQVLTLDQSAPVVTLLNPEEGGRFNEKLVLNGIASDNYALDSVEVNLRSGDKSSYEVPGFIQGLYLDGHALGSNTWEAGVGLTFFDDNVRLQAGIGQAPVGRFEGLVLGAKLLANVAKIPFQSFLGPDFSWLSTSLAVGAKFSYFTMTPDMSLSFDKGVMLGGVVVHWDVVRMTYDAPFFNSIAPYFEPEIWMISSDVEAGFIFKLSFGVTMDVL